VPIEIGVPSEPGHHRLLVCPVVEGRRWADEAGIEVPVEVRPDAGTVEAALDLRPGDVPLDYAADHDVALKMLGRRAADILAAPGRRLLEIGGGASPQISWFGPHEVVNVDISMPLLELGALWYRSRAPADVAANVAFLCADAYRLPFDDDTFDVVAMFATLHHFAEPEALLAECRRVASGDGLVAVLCEPVRDSLEADVIVRDLLKGVNEQVFTVPEYLRIFAAAGLRVTDGDQSGGSLRAFLVPSEPSGERFGT
jgi:SAM-dependent methyltransferase